MLQNFPCSMEQGKRSFIFSKTIENKIKNEAESREETFTMLTRRWVIIVISKRNWNNDQEKKNSMLTILTSLPNQSKIMGGEPL